MWEEKKASKPETKKKPKLARCVFKCAQRTSGTSNTEIVYIHGEQIGRILKELTQEDRGPAFRRDEELVSSTTTNDAGEQC